MRHLRLCLVVGVVIAGVLGVSAPLAAASTAIVNGHSSGASCAVGAQLTGGPFLVTSNMVAVSNGGGGYALTCQFKYPSGSQPTSLLTMSGFPCFVWFDPLLVTYDSLFLATPGGQATLLCRLRL
jgi:hypothetical protein